MRITVLFLGFLIMASFASAADKMTDLQCVALRQIIDAPDCPSDVVPAMGAKTASYQEKNCEGAKERKSKAIKLFEQNECYKQVYKDLDQMIKMVK